MFVNTEINDHSSGMTPEPDSAPSPHFSYIRTIFQCSVQAYALKMEAAGSFETMVLIHHIRREETS
jgi:hypothetical protein